MNRVMNVNFMGTLFCMQAEIEAMRKQEPKPNPWNAKRQPERGSIINMMSVASWVVGPSAAQYAASKHALHAITKGAGIYFILLLFPFSINELWLTSLLSSRSCCGFDPSKRRLSWLGRHTYGKRSRCSNTNGDSVR